MVVTGGESGTIMMRTMNTERVQDFGGDVPKTCAFHNSYNSLSRAVFGSDRPLEVVKNIYSVEQEPVLTGDIRFFSKGFFTLSFYEKEPVLRKKKKSRD